MMLNFLLQLSVALAGGAVYSLALLGVLVVLDKACRARSTKRTAASGGFAAATRHIEWDEGEDLPRYTMN